MNRSKEPAPPRLSTGVELECAVLYVFHSGNVFSDGGKDEKIIDDELPQPFCVPFPIDSYKVDLESIGQRAVENALRETLKEANLPTDIIEIKAGETLAAEHLSLFRHWAVAVDSSIRAPGLKFTKNHHKLRFAAIEIKTPVEWDSPLSFEVIRYAVNVLTSKFRIEINPSMGLHVHIGYGAEWLPFHWVRRMSTLFWAADRLLATLNPPTRSYNYFCPGIRDFSQLAQNSHKIGVPEHDREEQRYDWYGNPRAPLLCRKYIATDVRTGESSTIWREAHTDQSTIDEFSETRQPGHFEPFFVNRALGTEGSTNVSPKDPEVLNKENPLISKSADSDDLIRISSTQFINEKLYSPNERTRAELTHSLDGVESSQTTPGLGKRLNGFRRVKLPKWSESDLMNIDQVNYDYSDHAVDRDRAADRGVWFGVQQISQTSSSCEIASMLDSGYRANFNLQQYKCEYIGRSRSYVKGTIEWRQGAGSMDAKWVSTWARIVVGVSRFAIHAPVDLLLRIIDCCDFAEKGGSYDVLDFLEDIGLVAEAQVAGQRLSDYGEDWGIKYEGQSDYCDGEEVEEIGDGKYVKECEKREDSKTGEEGKEEDAGKEKVIEMNAADGDSDEADYVIFL